MMDREVRPGDLTGDLLEELQVGGSIGLGSTLEAPSQRCLPVVEVES